MCSDKGHCTIETLRSQKQEINSLLQTTSNTARLKCYFVLELVAALEARISGMMWKDEDKNWNCSVCGKISKSKTDITRHVEGLHLDHPGFKCDLCGELVKSRNALRQHKSNRHGTAATTFY